MPIRPVSQIATCVLTALGTAPLFFSADTRAAESDTSILSLHGFGTLGEVHSDLRDADFVGNAFQPNGAGYSRSWAPGVDSKLGVQVDAHLTDKFLATLQVVSQHRYDDKWTPQVEWANLKYQFTPDFSIRAGRTAANFFMLSDTRLVGYVYPWIRPPVELYSEVPITNLEGIGLNYRLHLGSVTHSGTLTYATTKVDVPGGGRLKSARNFFVIGYTLETGAMTVRVGYESFLADVHTPGLDALFAGFTQLGGVADAFGFTSTGAQAIALGDKYRLTGVHYSVASVGAIYDPGDWLVMTEWVKVHASAAISNSAAWYVTAGHRFDNLTPYATLSGLGADTRREPGISTVGLPPPLAAGAAALNAGLTQSFDVLAPSQRDLSGGVRWDFMKNTDLKVQYDRVTLGAGSSGRLGNFQPGFQPGATVNVISVSVDFVF